MSGFEDKAKTSLLGQRALRHTSRSMNMTMEEEESRPFLSQDGTADNGNQMYGSIGDADVPPSESEERTSVNAPQSSNEDEDDGDDDSDAHTNADRDDERHASERTQEGTDADDDSDPESRDGAIGSLTRRLRCLFSAITWPIVPLGTLVAFALLWVFYTASSADFRSSCSHPLHLYALASLILVAYIPHHAQVRSRLFNYSRERDGPIRPVRVRMYDQVFHTVCLLYVYAGVALIQTCRDDLVDNNPALAQGAQPLAVTGLAPSLPLNTCAATCPNLYQALSVYVATLEMFTFALILPLLFLPCIYLWFLRRATAEAESLAQLQGRFQDDESVFRSRTMTASEILDNLDHVRLVSKDISDESGESKKAVFLSASDASEASISRISEAKECCICMCDFTVQDEAEAEKEHEGTSNTPEETSTARQGPSIFLPLLSLAPLNAPKKPPDEEGAVVRTHCGHVFHKECLAGWVGGRWHLDPSAGGHSESNSQSDQRRPAQQTCCPLCREDLRPHSTV